MLHKIAFEMDGLELDNTGYRVQGIWDARD
jgi:hypothetical protein